MKKLIFFDIYIYIYISQIQKLITCKIKFVSFKTEGVLPKDRCDWNFGEITSFHLNNLRRKLVRYVFLISSGQNPGVTHMERYLNIVLYSVIYHIYDLII